MTTTYWITPAVSALIDLAIEEDLGRGDVTAETLFPDNDERRKGQVIAKEPLVACGAAVFAEVCRRVDPRITVSRAVADGTRLPRTGVALDVEGPVRALLGAERTALNFLQRLSGVATLTRAFVDAVEGTRATIVDTRKTTPGWRLLDKRAVQCGGARNHRADLGSGVLIKDNHIAACGGVGAAIERARARAPHTLRIEIEVTSMDQLEAAIAARAEIVLLDNMSPTLCKAAVTYVAGRALTEISGGVTLETVRAYADAGCDLISVGALTHSARAVDLSLEL